VEETPRKSRAVAAEKSPGPGSERGRKVTTTPEAAVQQVKSKKIRSAGHSKRVRRPAPSRSSCLSGEDTPRAAKKASRGAEAPIRKTRA